MATIRVESLANTKVSIYFIFNQTIVKYRKYRSVAGGFRVNRENWRYREVSNVESCTGEDDKSLFSSLKVGERNRSCERSTFFFILRLRILVLVSGYTIQSQYEEHSNLHVFPPTSYKFFHRPTCIASIARVLPATSSSYSSGTSWVIRFPELRSKCHKLAQSSAKILSLFWTNLTRKVQFVKDWRSLWHLWRAQGCL